MIFQRRKFFDEEQLWYVRTDGRTNLFRIDCMQNGLHERTGVCQVFLQCRLIQRLRPAIVSNLCGPKSTTIAELLFLIRAEIPLKTILHLSAVVDSLGVLLGGIGMGTHVTVHDEEGKLLIDDRINDILQYTQDIETLQDGVCELHVFSERIGGIVATSDRVRCGEHTTTSLEVTTQYRRS
jgi:hypothetical protein